MSEISDDTSKHYLLSSRIPLSLRDVIQKEASQFDLSLADVIRLRLASGSVAAAVGARKDK